jgi:hypothetical protein
MKFLERDLGVLRSLRRQTLTTIGGLKVGYLTGTTRLLQELPFSDPEIKRRRRYPTGASLKEIFREKTMPMSIERPW